MAVRGRLVLLVTTQVYQNLFSWLDFIENECIHVKLQLIGRDRKFSAHRLASYVLAFQPYKR